MTRWLMSVVTVFCAVTVLSVESKSLCMDGICIGDNVDLIDAKWKAVNLAYSDRKFADAELEKRDIKDIYYDFNELLIANKDVLTRILPYVISKQQFDGTVLTELSQVRAICSSLTLTGEIETGSTTRLFVTFRAVANKGDRGMLRVVRLEKQFKIMAPHIRPRDAVLFKDLHQELKKIFPDIKVVRDIDARFDSLELQTATAILGFRFISSISNPLIFRLLDDEDIPLIEDDDDASPLCASAQTN